MRQFVTIASLVALFMYTGFVLQQNTQPVLAGSATGDLTALEQALHATGANLERVKISGWVQVESAAVRETVARLLSWTNQQHSDGAQRDLKLHRKDGSYYLALQWTARKEHLADWPALQLRVRQALEQVGTNPVVTVQLEGRTEGADLPGLVDRALSAVAASDRQPWSERNSASAAGKSTLLPSSSFGLNIQVAARRQSTDGSTRIWVAWPALLQDY